MSVSLRPEALEGYLKMLVQNIGDTVAQIEGGQYPQFDDNCRRNIDESLTFLVRSRKQQRALDSDYATPKLSIPGLRMKHLPGTVTLSELRQIKRYVELG